MSATSRERVRLEPLLYAEADGNFNGTLQALTARLSAADPELVRLCLDVGARQGRWDATWTPTDKVAMRGKPR